MAQRKYITKAQRANPLECCYIDDAGIYTCVSCANIDRGITPIGNVKDSMDNGLMEFRDDKGKVLASCKPDRLSRARLKNFKS